MLLYDKRRGGDVAEKHSAGASKLQHIKQELLVSKHSRMMNMPCQPMMSVKNPPATGAATGAIPLMAPIIAIAFASSRPENLSAATDREITMPPDAPMPCRSRNATNQCIVGENIQPMVERINTAIETSSSGRRPMDRTEAVRRRDLSY